MERVSPFGGFPGSSAGKESACNAGDPRSIPQLNPEMPGGLQSAAAAAAKSLQLCPTLRDPIDGSLPGSPVPGILQARTLKWVAMSSPMLHSMGSQRVGHD